MSSAFDRRLLFPLLAWMALCGCSPPAPPAPVGGVGAVAKVARSADTADAAVRAVIDGLRKDHPEALWDFLPASYQQDLNDLGHDFARRMDPEVWSSAIKVVRKVASVFSSKKEFLAPLAPATDWGQLATLLRTLADSELGDLERLKTADGRAMLATSGAAAMKQWDLLTQFAGGLGELNLGELQVTLESSTGDTAVVVVDIPGIEPQPSEFVKVEGKWIPRTLAESWVEKIGEARARMILLSPDNLAGFKPRTMTLLASLDMVLDKLASSRNAGEFQEALAGLRVFQPLLAELKGAVPDSEAQDEAPADRAAPRTDQIVTLIIRGNLSDSAQDELTDRLRLLLAPADKALIELVGFEELTSYKLGPVDDVEALAKGLGFLEIVSVDPKTRTIVAKVKR